MRLQEDIYRLTEYGIQRGLIKDEDRIYTINRLLEVYGQNSFSLSSEDIARVLVNPLSLEEILQRLVDEAYDQGLITDDGITQRDLFDTCLMGVLTDRPSYVIEHFQNLYEKDEKQATDYFYQFSQDTNYIRRDRIAKDRKWKVESPFGDIDITINLSKPEKDPKAIAAARNMAPGGYPACQLCVENEGYAGRLNHPARQNHRVIPIEIHGEKWGFQYSPYVYYNEHCIVFNSEHVPMRMDRDTFRKMFDFVKAFPHYFVGSNAELPIVGGSILSHEHFQGGRYEFAMAKAPIRERVTIPGYEDVETGIVEWPLSVIRIRCKDDDRLVELGTHILQTWRNYSDMEVFICAKTETGPHNTVTPIARKVGDMYELDLVLRNNITTCQHPLGLFHPHAQWHNIKKENIGLIEVMGLAVLPARLKDEMDVLAEYLVGLKSVKDIEENEMIKKHAKWAASFMNNYIFTEENVMGILEKEIGKVFVHVLEDAGVFKCTEEGRSHFRTFINTL